MSGLFPDTPAGIEAYRLDTERLMNLALNKHESRDLHEMNCVEVAASATAVGVRNSKNTSGSILLLPTASWSRLLNQLGHR